MPLSSVLLSELPVVYNPSRAPLPPATTLLPAGVAMRISLVGTYHAECGAVTIRALLQILERIRPEVVFAEIPRTHVAAWMDGSHGTVESLAVAAYVATRAVDVVPVDLPKPNESFFREYEEVSRAIERTSPAFRRLADLNSRRTCVEGFSYLNSDACIEAWSDIYREERETVEYMRNSRLVTLYAQVRDLIEQRDLEMLSNIRAYCTTTDRTSGAFLVGAAHRKSLIDKIRSLHESDGARIEWDLDGLQARTL